MIPVYPYPSPYAEAAKRLREAIDMAAIQDAVDNLAASMHAHATGNTGPAHVNNTHATNIRDDLAAVSNEGGPRGRSVQRTHQRGGLT